MGIIYDSKSGLFLVLNTSDKVVCSNEKWTVCQDYIRENKD